MGKGKDCGCGCDGRGDCEENEMSEMSEARGRNRMVVRGGRLVRTKKTSMADKRASKQYYRRNKRKIAMRRRKREIRPEFKRAQMLNLRKKRSLGMVEEIGGLIEQIDYQLNTPDYYEESDDMDEMDEMEIGEEEVFEALEEQLEEAEELAEEYAGTEFGDMMEELAEGIEENIAALEEGELDLEEAVAIVESGDQILAFADALTD